MMKACYKNHYGRDRAQLKQVVLGLITLITSIIGVVASMIVWAAICGWLE
jgi:hypothetical protein